jgi:hypothetical protein
MINITLAVAFALAFLLSPGRRILQLTIDGPVFQSLPAYQAHLLLVFANYWVPAVLVYLTLRVFRAELWIRPRPAIHLLLGLANVLLVIYILLRTFASSVEGGGASFLVMSFAPYVIIPARIMLTIGLVWLAVRSNRERKKQPHIIPKRLGVGGIFGIIMVLALPAAVIAWSLFLEEKSHFRIAAEAERAFHERCAEAGERIFDVPQNVQSVYFDPDWARYFENIIQGVYSGQGEAPSAIR